jgi:phosphate transport system substrate-binding protein
MLMKLPMHGSIAFALAVAVATALLAQAARAQQFATPTAPTDAAGVDAGSAAARAERLAARAHAPRYTQKFDLSGLPHYKPEQQVTGTLRIFGNNYIGDSPLAKYWEDAFRTFQPGVTFKYYLPSAAVAIPGLYFDLADLGVNHMPSFYDDLAHVRIKGYEPTEISAVTGAYDVTGWQNTLVIVVNKNNPLTNISMEQLDGVFGSLRDGGWEGITWHPEFARGADQDIRTWGRLGLGGAWSKRHINVYGYAVRYASAVEFSNRVLQASDKWNGDLHAVGNYVDPQGKRFLEADQILDKLRADVNGIGYVRYHEDFPKDIKILALALTNKGPFVDFNIENVQSRKYPFYGEQSFYMSLKPGTKPDPKIREYLNFILSQEGQELVEKDGKYLPLTAEVVAAQRRKLQ